MSAEKTLDILDLFNFKTRELTVPEIAQLLNQPQSSVYRHLRVLKEKGYVIETNGGMHKLGYRFLEMAKIVRTDNSISSLALPVMRQLTSETGETSILTIISGLNVVCLETVSPSQPIEVTAEQGQIMPLYGGASSKALLAYLPDETVVELFKQGIVKKHTSRTILDIDQLRQNLKEIRDKGYAVSDSELDEGVLAYAVPIRDSDNIVIASLTIAGPRERMLVKDANNIIDHLQSGINEIQKYL
ncbi:IclR family transcriptional regulator [Paenibacillus agricola]|uniref:IclR family transcriptional regulator n=1 Tax=Paenibacillus agricola TaxID=2716264 RepID=A0ABX0JHH9_9BACL|nr:IclR family transcriptional regulator [Paenibacillus agricola]NHN34153.1 IclR family transcriptional regulator [Paenibacillus agricola]